MIKVQGLPAQITKADLDELFLPYGIIQITKEQPAFIRIEKERSTAYVKLDELENERRAIHELNDKLFRDTFVLKVASITP